MKFAPVNEEKSNFDAGSTSECSSDTVNIPSIISAVSANIQTIKKSNYYHIHVAETKKHLDDIYQKIESLIDSSEILSWKIQAKNSELSFITTQIHSLNLEYDETCINLDLMLNFYGIDDKNVLSDNILLLDFVEKYIDNYFASKNLPNHQKMQEKPFMQKELFKKLDDMFFMHSTTIPTKKNTIDKIQERQNNLQQKVADLEKEYDELIQSIKLEQKNYQETSKQWLLKSYLSDIAPVSTDDFVASPSVQQKIHHIISLYKHPEQVKEHQLSLPKSLLFLWNSDTGKTYTAKYLASQLDRPLYHIHAYDLLTEDFKWPKPLYILDAIVEETQTTGKPCIIFLDNLEKIVDLSWEFEAVLMKYVLNIQKSDLDIIVVSALGERQKISTPDILNHAVFPEQICFNLPKEEEKRKLLEVYIKDFGKDFFSDVSIDDLLPEFNKINHNVSAQHIKRFVSESKNFCVSRRIAGETNYKLTLHDVRSVVSALRYEDRQNGKIKYFE